MKEVTIKITLTDGSITLDGENLQELTDGSITLDGENLQELTENDIIDSIKMLISLNKTLSVLRKGCTINGST